ncbi:hypothetical protein H6G89_31850 [Oscillatoria sp. FACHB-1407]|uniref:hypothetical protein n=1 Tax=Oscillatoria sp. FACHB-1407 TaxID=2692847 RepID=UPI00168580EE|nr:hypothetical protein [Oscillatoria sp. FACHB-1407]MBD2465589.1 hypothetical protein [Oscillatoria sp. FACHB-1407]
MILGAKPANHYQINATLSHSKEEPVERGSNFLPSVNSTPPSKPSLHQTDNPSSSQGNHLSSKAADTKPADSLNRIAHRTKNYEALQELTVEAEGLLGFSMDTAFCNMKPGFINDLISKAAGLLAELPLRRYRKLMQLCPSIEKLLQEFGSEEVEIFPEIKTGHGDLDLFVRFPSKQYFAIALRAVGYAAITYREDKEALYFKYLKGAKGVKRWNIDHLKDLSDQEFWIRKNEKELFGTSARDVRRPLTKILALAGETQLGKNSEHLYLDTNEVKALAVQRKSTTYVMEETELVSFIRYWLKKHA